MDTEDKPGFEIPSAAVAPTDLREDSLDERLEFAEKYGMSADSDVQRVGRNPKALGLWTAIVPDDLATQSRGGIWLPPKARKRQEQFRIGTVASVGQGTKCPFYPDGYRGRRIWKRHGVAPEVQPGDRVIYSRHHADPVEALVKLPGERKAKPRMIAYTQAENVWCKLREEKSMGALTKLQPIGDGIVIKRVETEEVTPGGIVLPDNAKEKPQRGQVLAVGPGKQLDNGEYISLGLKPGDMVLFGKYTGHEIAEEGVDLILMRSDDILAKLEE